MATNHLKKTVHPGKFGNADFEEFTLDQNVDWVKELLLELNENAVDQTPEAYLDQTNLEIKLKIKSHQEHTMGNLLIVHAEVKAHFATACTITLKEMFDEVEFSVDGCYIPQHYEDSEEYTDQTEIFMAGGLKELYFMKNHHADLGELIHEHLFLNIHPYPTIIDAEDQGDYHQSGKLKN